MRNVLSVNTRVISVHTFGEQFISRYINSLKLDTEEKVTAFAVSDAIFVIF